MSSHHSLQYFFFGLLLLSVAFIWIILATLEVQVPEPYIVPFGLMILGAAAIAAALVWHRLTKS